MKDEARAGPARSRASACWRSIRTGRILTPGTPLAAGQPELRRYRARWRDDDQPFVGDWSDIVQVTARL